MLEELRFAAHVLVYILGTTTALWFAVRLFRARSFALRALSLVPFFVFLIGVYALFGFWQFYQSSTKGQLPRVTLIEATSTGPAATPGFSFCYALMRLNQKFMDM